MKAVSNILALALSLAGTSSGVYAYELRGGAVVLASTADNVRRDSLFGDDTAGMGDGVVIDPSPAALDATRPKASKENEKKKKTPKSTTAKTKKKTAMPTTSPTPISCEEGYVLIDGNCTHACDAGTHGCVAGTVCFKTIGADFRCLNPIVEELIPPDERQHVLNIFHGSVFDEIATDSPIGFISGQFTFNQDPIQEELPLNFEAKNSIIVLSGKFEPAAGNIPEGFRARVYSQRGLLTESIVSQVGDFEITLTDIIPGLSPFIIVVVQMPTSANLNQVTSNSTEEPPERRLANAGTALFWCINNVSICEANSTLTYKLTWDKPNDVDLHVIEPSGTEVYYGYDKGDHGELDFDNQEGFGPEHYISNSTKPGQTYTARVHLFASDSEILPVNFVLEAYYRTSLLWHEPGILTEVDQYSKDFKVSIPEDEDTSCKSCAPSAPRLLKAVEGDQACCDHIVKFPWWCKLWGCNDSHINGSWKVKQHIIEMKANEKNILYFLNTIIAPMLFVRDESEERYFDLATEAIRNRGGDYECLRKGLLKAYCKILSRGWINESYLGNVAFIFARSKQSVSSITETVLMRDVQVFIAKVFFFKELFFVHNRLVFGHHMRDLYRNVQYCGFSVPCVGGFIKSGAECPRGFSCLENCDFGKNDPKMFNIDLSLQTLNDSPGVRDLHIKNALLDARHKWMEVIVSDLPPVPSESIPWWTSQKLVCKDDLPLVVDDLHICVQEVKIDDPNTLGQGGLFWKQTNKLTGKTRPLAGEINLNTNAVQSLWTPNNIYATILHEMGHILGIGNLWKENGVLDNDNNYRWDTKATDVWKKDWGCVGTPPVEKHGGEGTKFVHWDEDCLVNELMTGSDDDGMDDVLSNLTLASLEDIGYKVNYDAAGAFDGRNTSCCKAGRLLHVRGTSRTLSDAGRDAAVAYGKKILGENQLSDEVAFLLEQDETGLEYVGDKMVSVFVIEDGIIFDVFVTKDDE